MKLKNPFGERLTNLRRSAEDFGEAYNPFNSLTLGQRASKAMGGAAGFATRGAAPDFGASEFGTQFFAPRAGASAATGAVFPGDTTTTTRASFGGEMAGPALPEDDAFENDLSLVDDDEASASGTGGSSTAAAAKPYVPEYRTVQGDPTRYDINDPAQAKAYYDKRLALAESFRTKNLGDLDALYTNRLKSADLDYNDQVATLDDRVRDVDTSEAEYARNYDDRVGTFGKNYSTSQAKRLNAFAGASGFQSAQGDSERLAYGEYNEGLDDLAAEKTSNQNAFADTRTKLGSQKTLAQEKFNLFQDDLSREIGTKRSDIDRSVNDFKSEASAELAPFDYANGISDYKDRYQLESYNPVQTQIADLSRFRNATSFSGATGPAATATSPANAFTPPTTKGSPLEQYLDVTKEKKQKDPMKQYLYA